MLLEFLIALGILPGCIWSVPTVCVDLLWAGVDSVQEQEKSKPEMLDAREALQRPAVGLASIVRRGALSQ